MSINDQGPQNAAQAEAEAVSRYLSEAELALYGADGKQIVSAGRVAQWCAAKVAGATAAMRERVEKAETECRAREDVQARLIRERNAAEAEVARLRGLLDAKPYTPRVGDAFTWDGRHFIFAGPAERAAAGLAPEAHAQPQQPQVLKEHLAWIEADAELTAITFHDKYDFEASLAAKDRAVAASIALRAAVARRDGGVR